MERKLKSKDGRRPEMSEIFNEREDCYQPEDPCFKLKSYSGSENKTLSGKACEYWNDESYQKHNYKPSSANHNYCRSPVFGDETPWCYIRNSTSGQKWENCDVGFCQEKKPEENEFISGQQICGINNSTDLTTGKQRIVSKCRNCFETKIGQVPMMGRIRVLENGWSRHLCGATLISTCWAVTSASCSSKIKNRKLQLENIRFDVGSMMHYNGLYEEYQNVEISNQFNFHQSFKIQKGLDYLKQSRVECT